VIDQSTLFQRVFQLGTLLVAVTGVSKWPTPPLREQVQEYGITFSGPKLTASR